MCGWISIVMAVIGRQPAMRAAHCQPDRIFLSCVVRNVCGNDNAVLRTKCCRLFLRCMATMGRAAAVALVMTATCRADETRAYPSRPVRIVVPYGPGGIADVTMRLVAKQLSEHFGQQF